MSQKNQSSEESGSSPRRFRLPKLFADNADDTLPQDLIDNAGQQANAQDDLEEQQKTRRYSRATRRKLASSDEDDDEWSATTLPERTTFGAPSEYSPQFRNQNIAPLSEDVEDDTESEENATSDVGSFAAQPVAPVAPVAPSPQPAPVADAAYAAVLLHEMEQMRDEVDNMSRIVSEIHEQGTAHDRVFDTLHAELQGYKNDFIYEHLKPVVRSLLFLYDSLEQFDGEMLAFEQARPNERREFSPSMVRENVIFFRSQLVESLRICEVVPMGEPKGFLDPRLHKAVDVVAVGPELDRVVLRLVRSGWYLNGRVFRPAEVIVGRCDMEGSDAS